jgi:hypothetical protein
LTRPADYTVAALDHLPEEGTPPVPYWMHDPQLRAAQAHARTQRLARQATEKAEAERNAAMREHKEGQEQARERIAEQRAARLATNPL